MIPYLSLVGVLILFAFIQEKSQAKAFWGYSSSVFVTLFIGLRFQVGFDWIAYESIWRDAMTLDDFVSPSVATWDTRVEIGYQILNIFVKTFTDSFDLFQLVLAVFNGVVLYKVFNRVSPGNSSACWLIYMCFAGIPVQMVLLRQALASSLVLLGLLDVIDNKRFQAGIWILLASTLHVSAIAFAPLAIFGTFSPGKTLIGFATLSMFGVFLFSETSLVNTIMLGLTNVSFLTDRVSSYVDIAGSKISFGTYGLISMHIVLLCLFVFHRNKLQFSPIDNFRRSQFQNNNFRSGTPKSQNLNKAEFERRLMSLSVWLTFYILAAHLVFSDFPSVWNRTMAVTLPFQLSVFWISSPISNRKKWHKLVILSVISIISVSSIAYQITRPQSAITPYATFITVWLFGDDGTRKANISRIQNEIWSGY